MKHGKKSKKAQSSKSNSKRSNKKKVEKRLSSKKGDGNNDNKKRGKKSDTGKLKNVGSAKRGTKKRVNKLSAKERAIYGDFKTLLKQDNKLDNVPAAKVRKKRNDNLFIISLNQRGFQNKVNALRKADFSIIEKYLRKQSVEPLYAFVTLKIKKPNDTGYYFNGKKSPAPMIVNSDNTKRFCIEVLIEYNNEMIDMIHEKYDDSDMKVYNVIEMSIRFLFRTK